MKLTYPIFEDTKPLDGAKGVPTARSNQLYIYHTHDFTRFSGNIFGIITELFLVLTRLYL